ncbi:MAG: hypothetical protein CM1200mP41_27810 [Gammaproteobacteria bacterium]|nr:MAG: hypothetical protein CM1200mP41_27810 [Gammaproteobacteria bacterium]
MSSMAGVLRMPEPHLPLWNLDHWQQAGNRLLGVTYPSLAAVEKAYDGLGRILDIRRC